MNKLARVIQGFTVLAILLLFSFTTSFAHVDPPKYVKTNWGNTMTNFALLVDNTQPPGCINILEDNLLVINVRAYFAFNDLHNYPDCYLGYNFGNLETGISPKIEGSDLQLTTIDGIALYYKEFVFTIDVSSICTSPGAMAPFNYEIALMTATQQVYPTADYDGANEIFSAAVFPENTPGVQQPPYYQGNKTLCCPGQNISVSGRSSDDDANNGQIRPVEISDDVLLGEIKAFPNPFNEFLTLGLPNDFQKSESQIIIRDITGKIRWEGRLTDAFDLTIDTKRLESGIYIVTVLQKNKYLHKRVVKNSL